MILDSYSLEKLQMLIKKRKFHITFTGCWLDTLFPHLDVFSSLVLVFLCIMLLLIARSCHFLFCAFVTLNKKDCLLAYLLMMWSPCTFRNIKQIVLFSATPCTSYYSTFVRHLVWGKGSRDEVVGWGLGDRKGDTKHVFTGVYGIGSLFQGHSLGGVPRTDREWRGLRVYR